MRQQNDSHHTELPVTACIPSWNRPSEAQQAVQSLVRSGLLAELSAVFLLDNGSKPPYSALNTVVERHDRIRIIRTGKNLGAGGGRNRLLDEVQTPFVLFFDDDCTVQQHSQLAQALELMKQRSSLATITFDIWEQRGATKILRTPAKRRMRERGSTPFTPCFGFIGGCFLARVDFLRQVGGFPEETLFGSEELAVSHRLRTAGFTFGRSCHVSVVHHPSTDGRLQFHEYGPGNLATRCTIARRNFGFPMNISQIAVALVSFVVKSHPNRLRADLRRSVEVARLLNQRESNRPVNKVRMWNFRSLALLGLRAWS